LFGAREGGRFPENDLRRPHDNGGIEKLNRSTRLRINRVKKRREKSRSKMGVANCHTGHQEEEENSLRVTRKLQAIEETKLIKEEPAAQRD